MNTALACVLELLAASARDGTLSRSSEDEPWFDFGTEPLTLEGAEAELPEFLRRVQSVFFESPGPYPFCCARRSDDNVRPFLFTPSVAGPLPRQRAQRTL